MIESMRNRMVSIVMAFVVAVTLMFGVQLATADDAQAYFSCYTGGSYTSHNHGYSWARTVDYTIYSGVWNGYRYNEFWTYYPYYDSWDYYGWNYQYNC